MNNQLLIKENELLKNERECYKKIDFDNKEINNKYLKPILKNFFEKKNKCEYKDISFPEYLELIKEQLYNDLNEYLCIDSFKFNKLDDLYNDLEDCIKNYNLQFFIDMKNKIKVILNQREINKQEYQEQQKQRQGKQGTYILQGKQRQQVKQRQIQQDKSEQEQEKQRQEYKKIEDEKLKYYAEYQKQQEKKRQEYQEKIKDSKYQEQQNNNQEFQLKLKKEHSKKYCSYCNNNIKKCICETPEYIKKESDEFLQCVKCTNWYCTRCKNNI
jgi:hypothetical protein